MPEGPEVKDLTNKLNKKYKNKILSEINILGGRYKKHGAPKNMNLFIKVLPLKIRSINCHGKFIYWLFYDSEFVLFNTLGMEGYWITREDKYNHVSFKINNKNLYFNDFRNFGTLIFCYKNNLEKKLKELGPDILSPEDNFKEFKKRTQNKKTVIGKTLINQKVLAGVGNYLRAEGLYVAKINPFRLTSSLSDKELRKLYDILRQISWIFYDVNKGIKLNIINKKYNLINLYNKTKYPFLVYRQKIDIFNNKVNSKKIDNRTIYYVSSLQK